MGRASRRVISLKTAMMSIGDCNDYEFIMNWRQNFTVGSIIPPRIVLVEFVKFPPRRTAIPFLFNLLLISYLNTHYGTFN